MHLMELQPGDPRPVYRQIVDEIQRCVAVGIMRPDEALPAARALAREGTVYIKRGMGTFVSPTPKEPKNRQAMTARRIAEKMLREGFRHGLLASDLIAALKEISPREDR